MGLSTSNFFAQKYGFAPSGSDNWEGTYAKPERSGEWDEVANQPERYLASFVGQKIEEWIDLVGPSVARRYTGLSDWSSISSISYAVSVSFQLLGQDFLDGTYNGDISTHKFVNLLSWNVGYNLFSLMLRRGCETAEILDPSNYGNSRSPEYYFGGTDEGPDTYLAGTRTDNQSIQRWGRTASCNVTYDDTPGNEFFAVMIYGATTGRNYIPPNDISGPEFQPNVPNVSLIFGWYRIQNLDTTVPGANGRDSGWATFSYDSENASYISKRGGQHVLINQGFAEQLLMARNEYGPVSDEYFAPYGRPNLYPKCHPALYHELEAPVNFTNGVTGSAVNLNQDARYNRSQDPEKKSYYDRFNKGWIKNAPLYTNLGHKIGTVHPYLLVGSGFSFYSETEPTMLRKTLGNEVYYSVCNHYAWRVE